MKLKQYLAERMGEDIGTEVADYTKMLSAAWRLGARAVLEQLTHHDSMKVCDAAQDILDAVGEM